MLDTATPPTVVYHYNPTSNRNIAVVAVYSLVVVYHYNPTSNRNYADTFIAANMLYIIIILHQTATNNNQ